MYWLYAITGLAIMVSLITSRGKTLQALKISYRRFINILPAFLMMLILVSVVLFLVPDAVISEYLNAENKFAGVLLASLLGSITLMPGFIAKVTVIRNAVSLLIALIIAVVTGIFFGEIFR